ncbi:hypothetical protein V8C86DRAFT_3142105, partial [Haematococcus lacustris]
MPPPSPPLPPQPPSPPPPASGICSDPQLIDVGTGTSVWVPSVSTCNTPSSWSCRGAKDYTYQLAAASIDRTITVSTCVDDVAAWDTVLYAFPTQGSSCPTCPAGAVADDDGGSCGVLRSQLTITALAGQAYTVVVEGYASLADNFNGEDCGVPAITVTSNFMPPPSPPFPPSPPHPPLSPPPPSPPSPSPPPS